jgi:pimeloyl-ACP methyl ester carboxylesterase
MSPRSIAQLIFCLISALQIGPPYIVGNSLGGYQALWFAVLFPCPRPNSSGLIEPAISFM